jgi:hypothetical protein
MAVQGETVERWLRGGIGSTLAHAALAALLTIPLSPPGEPAESAAGSGFAFAATTKLGADLAPHRDEDLPFRGPAAEGSSEGIPLSIDNGPGGARFSIDLVRIRERRSDLFPFVTWDLGFLRSRPWDAHGNSLEFHSPLTGVAPPAGEVLRLSPQEVQSIVDRAFSRRHRWSNLEELVNLAERYRGDRGDLAAVFREYAQQNVPQPYGLWSDEDPVFWIMLMLSSDDAPLIEYVARYLRRYPTNEISTELLFLLDASAESSCDVLGKVLLAGTAELPLRATQFRSPEAFELATSLASAYRNWVRRHGSDVSTRCLTARIAILRRIIDTSPLGYGASDARFRLGELLWRAGRRQEAVEWWAGMTADPRDQYGAVRKAIKGALDDGAYEHRPERVSSTLRDAEARWRIFAAERLDHFGLQPTEF